MTEPVEIVRIFELFMTAEARDFLARQFARLQHRGACVNFDFGAIYDDIRHQYTDQT